MASRIDAALTRRAGRRAASPRRPPPTTRTAPAHSTPANKQAAASATSGIAEPHTLQAGQPEEAPHPHIAASHDDEHREQECLAGRVVVRIEIGRAECREHDEEDNRERDDDGRGRARLHLERARLTLDLLRTADARLELVEQTRHLTA